MTHWTYDNFKAEDDIQQGDIIQRTPELLDVLQEAHKHFLDPKYSAFIILTQSCDLVRRRGKACKSRYINLAVVRPLEDILLFLLDSACEKVVVNEETIPGFYISDSYTRARQLLERIINQNEQGQGIFYLHPDAEAGIAVHSVVLLQVSIALRYDHYEILVKARSGRLTKEFQSRLGWLIGNLYSRVATQDWEKRESEEIIKSYLNLADGPFWKSRESIREANRCKVDLTGIPAVTVDKILSEYRPTQPVSIAIDRTSKIIKDVIQGTSDQDIEKIKNRLLNDQRYSSAFRKSSLFQEDD